MTPTTHVGWAKAPDFDEQPEIRARIQAATAADRREYLEAGLRPVLCAACGNRVRAKKNSPVHTSIQWTTDAVRSCPEFAAVVAAGGSTALVDGCPKLRESINRTWEEPDDG